MAAIRTFMPRSAGLLPKKRTAFVAKDRPAFEAQLSEARSLAAEVTDSDGRKMLEDDLDTLAWQLVASAILRFAEESSGP